MSNQEESKVFTREDFVSWGSQGAEKTNEILKNKYTAEELIELKARAGRASAQARKKKKQENQG